jgi:hypothetical protein
MTKPAHILRFASPAFPPNKPHVAKATLRRRDTQRVARRLIDHVQCLAGMPAAIGTEPILLLERWAAEFRRLTESQVRALWEASLQPGQETSDDTP